MILSSTIPESFQSDSIRPNKSIRRSAQHYCGRLLISVLSLVCQGKYNGPSGSSSSLLPYDGEQSLEQQKLSHSNINLIENPNEKLSPFRNNHEIFKDWHTYPRTISQSHPNLSHRFKRGVVEECCHNSCTLRQLRAYCLGQGSRKMDDI